MDKIILGQEAVCPDGLGRVVDFSDKFPDKWIQIETYVRNRSCKWSIQNVQLVNVILSDQMKNVD